MMNRLRSSSLPRIRRSISQPVVKGAEAGRKAGGVRFYDRPGASKMDGRTLRFFKRPGAEPQGGTMHANPGCSVEGGSSDCLIRGKKEATRTPGREFSTSVLRTTEVLRQAGIRFAKEYNYFLAPAVSVEALLLGAPRQSGTQERQKIRPHEDRGNEIKITDTSPNRTHLFFVPFVQQILYLLIMPFRILVQNV
jgi:hypothetical protein